MAQELVVASIADREHAKYAAAAICREFTEKGVIPFSVTALMEIIAPHIAERVSEVVVAQTVASPRCPECGHAAHIRTCLVGGAHGFEQDACGCKSVQTVASPHDNEIIERLFNRGLIAYCEECVEENGALFDPDDDMRCCRHGNISRREASRRLFEELAAQSTAPATRVCLDCGAEITGCNGHVLADGLVKAMAGEIPFSQVKERCPKCEVRRSLPVASPKMPMGEAPPKEWPAPDYLKDLERLASPTAEEIARKIITEVCDHAIGLAIVRHMLVAEDRDELDELEISQDVVACMVGDDTGCLDPDDPKARETLDKVAAAIRDYAATLTHTPKTVASPSAEQWLNKVVPLQFDGSDSSPLGCTIVSKEQLISIMTEFATTLEARAGELEMERVNLKADVQINRNYWRSSFEKVQAERNALAVSLRDVGTAVSSEIKWHKEHLGRSGRGEVWESGFLAGLQQAEGLIRAVKEMPK